MATVTYNLSDYAFKRFEDEFAKGLYNNALFWCEPSFTWSISSDSKTNNSFAMKKKDSIPQPKKIIYNNPYTCVLWDDDTKTIVKCMEGETWSEEMGFAACLLRKLYGPRTSYKKMLESVTYREYSKEEKKRYLAEKKAKKFAEKNEIEEQKHVFDL